MDEIEEPDNSAEPISEPTTPEPLELPGAEALAGLPEKTAGNIRKALRAILLMSLAGCVNIDVQKVPAGTEMSSAAAKEVIDIVGSFPYPPDCDELKGRIIVSALRFTTLEKVNQNDKSAELSDGMTKVKLSADQIENGLRVVKVDITKAQTSSGAFNGSITSHCHE